MEKKSIMHYNNHQKILLVGDGDFSFSLSLAKAFGSASNMVATSLDSKVTLTSNYSKASANLQELEKLGCTLLHEMDAHFLHRHPLLQNKVFDRIVYNFPHAGFFYPEADHWQIRLHQNLVLGFMQSARKIVSQDGEIHVTHKTCNPYCKWDVVKLAEEAELLLVEEVAFKRWDYPGYVNKRGSGSARFLKRRGKLRLRSNWDRTFKVGSCSTFKFSKPPEMQILELKLEASSCEMEQIELELEVPLLETGLEAPLCETQQIELELEAPLEQKLEMPSCEMQQIELDLEVPSCETQQIEMELEAPLQLKLEALPCETQQIELELEAPLLEMELEVPSGEMQQIEIGMKAPSGETQQVELEMKAPSCETDMECLNSLFCHDSLHFSLP
ncbi:hypothetical protein RJT34_10848 [Clitoria ternatea]|uniref:25S rRNA (uridine-N(3))-methyltransferase BMT5-like domain-containing protein n=1 Tax=Clitoria ternatea TaxID=43366 RepID=A0AAN9PJZ1_CLITE